MEFTTIFNLLLKQLNTTNEQITSSSCGTTPKENVLLDKAQNYEIKSNKKCIIYTC